MYSFNSQQGWILPIIITDVSSSAAALEVSLEPDLCLDGFCPVDLSELTTAIVSSKPSTCILDPIPTRLFQEVNKTELHQTETS